jgi:hypothetical protein
MAKAIDLTGKRFGRLLVIKRAPNHICPKSKLVAWECKCDCGNVKVVLRCALRSGETNSCGCLHNELLVSRNTKHGDTPKYAKHYRLYAVWSNMRRRCSDKANKSYANYGGRGIKVCDEWNVSYLSFREWACNNGYDPNAKYAKCTIDRTDNDGDYTPENCRFVSFDVQANNRRKRKTTPIRQYDKNDTLIKEWGDSLAIKTELGYDRACISRACNGVRETAYGYKWRYV